MPIGSSIGNDNDDDAEFVEENIGYPVSSVRNFLEFHMPCLTLIQKHFVYYHTLYLSYVFCKNAAKDKSLITKNATIWLLLNCFVGNIPTYFSHKT